MGVPDTDTCAKRSAAGLDIAVPALPSLPIFLEKRRPAGRTADFGTKAAKGLTYLSGGAGIGAAATAAW